jgi:peptidoglycan/xylan/chitin deacetylase (PgdA/CDA1 family)
MLAQARAKLRPLSGRPVLITFDDGYVDTATTAWPILKDSDFSAEVFLVTDLVGAAAHWDAAFAEPAPLMDWDTIRTLHDEGMNFGSHLATHKPAIYMSSNDLLDEALRSRLTLVEQLKADVHSIAAPYGLIDERFVQICRLAGYAIGFSCNEGFADVKSPNFNMPRFEVSGFYDIAQFASYLGRN